jgi:hypothetical protein
MEDQLTLLRLLVVLLLVTLGTLLAMVYLPDIPFVGVLPGDMEFDFPGISIYLPLTTSVLISALLTGIVYVLQRFSKK